MPSLTHRSLRLLTLAAAFGGAAALSAAPAGASTSKAAVKAKSAKKSKHSVARPDLVARGLHVDFLSDGFTIQATVANTGNRFARVSDTSIALSSDEVLDDDDAILEDVTIPRVQAGAERSIDTEVELPSELPEGDLFLLVCADGNEDVRERSEGNNCTSQLVASAEDDAAADDEDQSDSSDDSSDDESQDTVVGGM